MLPVLRQIPPHVVALADYEPLARERMTEAAWAYLVGGAADEITLRENRAAFDRLRLQNRVLRELAGGHTRLSLLGCEFEHPILLGPVAFQRLAHEQGERAAITGAAALSAGAVVSTQASVRLEELVPLARAPLWFQLYIQPDRDFTVELVRRAERAGYAALVLTADAPVNGARNREQRAGFTVPAEARAVNLEGMRVPAGHVARAGASTLFSGPLLEQAATWKDLAWLRDQTRLPIVLKGVLVPDDARRALDAGIGGLIVSNHGGRTLDTLPATIDALPAVVEAVGGQVPVLLDGGIRRGTDVLKALALGASAVLLGRPYVYGLAAAGAVGVAHVLHILRSEFEMAMALTGCRDLASIDRSVLWKAG